MNYSLLVMIFFINLVYITLNTLRTIFTMRGYRNIAPLIAVIEVIIYTIGLSTVMQYLDQPIYLIIYALGFGVGVYIGILIEDRLALGYSVIKVITSNPNHLLAEELRSRGYGVTIQTGYGRKGERLVLTILVPRANEAMLYHQLQELDPNAFYYSTEAKYINGGFWSKTLKPERMEDVTTEAVIHSLEDEVITKEDYISDEFIAADNFEEEKI